MTKEWLVGYEWKMSVKASAACISIFDDPILFRSFLAYMAKSRHFKACFGCPEWLSMAISLAMGGLFHKNM